MSDLTKGSVTGHLVSMGLFIAITMLVQTAYFLVDLFFVSQLGKEAVAGVSAAGNIMFLGMAISQIIGVGVMSLASRAIGAGDQPTANLVYNQGMGMALAVSAIAIVAGYTLGMRWVDALTADAATAEASRAYLAAYMPSIAAMFPSVALGSALRAAGVVQSPTIVQAGTLLLNIVLAPVLIAGWGTGMPLGVAGAGLASTVSVVVGLGAMVVIFPRVQKVMRWHRELVAPKLAQWLRLLGVGLPAAVEFFLLFVTGAVVYAVIKTFGAQAQAGFGIGGRVLQSVMLPAMAVAFSAAPIVGQNLGANNPARVRDPDFLSRPKRPRQCEHVLAHHLVEPGRIGARVHMFRCAPRAGQHRAVGLERCEPLADLCRPRPMARTATGRRDRRLLVAFGWVVDAAGGIECRSGISRTAA